MKRSTVRKIIQWLLFTVLILYLVSGLGIAQYRITESLTFGLLTKIRAFRLHDNLWIPLLVFLVLHVWWVPISKLLLKLKRKASPTGKNG